MARSGGPVHPKPPPDRILFRNQRPLRHSPSLFDEGDPHSVDRLHNAGTNEAVPKQASASDRQLPDSFPLVGKRQGENGGRNRKPLGPSVRRVMIPQYFN